jgi:hypothetical protein
MPTFDFNDGARILSSSGGSNVSVDFTDTSVPFTFSTTGNPGTNGIAYRPDLATPNGHISLSDFSGLGVFTLDVNSSQVNSNFGASGGNISLLLDDVISGAWNVTFVHETNAALNVQFVNVADNQNLSFPTTHNFSEIRFTATSTGVIEINSLTASIVCYLEGTGIATPTGRVAVQDLKSGDLVMTADGGTSRVNWIGIQQVDVRKSTPAKVNPVCIMQGAIAPGVPSRDLFVSPDHAVEIDGILYNGHALVNGTSIYQMAQMPLDGFTYYHIDTGTHELILAEDCPSETYLDAVGRDGFINGAEQADAPIIAEMARPRVAAKRMVPHDVANALADRADMLGLTKADRAA